MRVKGEFIPSLPLFSLCSFFSFAMFFMSDYCRHVEKHKTKTELV